MTKNELIEKHRMINVEGGLPWWDDVYTEFTAALEEAGIMLRGTPEFSGFWNQGDGARFLTYRRSLDLLVICAQTWQSTVRESYVVDGELRGAVALALDAYTTALLEHFEGWLLAPCTKAWLQDTDIAVLAPSRQSCHARSMDLDVVCDPFGDQGEPPELDVDELRWLRDTYRDIADALYETLRAEYEHLTSDEAVWDSLVANEIDKEVDTVENNGAEPEPPETTEEKHLCCA